MVFIINHRYVFNCRVHGNSPGTSEPQKGMGSEDDCGPSANHDGQREITAAAAVGSLTPLIGCWGLRPSCFWHHTCHFHVPAPLIGASHKGGLQGRYGYNVNAFLQAQQEIEPGLQFHTVKAPDWPRARVWISNPGRRECARVAYPTLEERILPPAVPRSQ